MDAKPKVPRWIQIVGVALALVVPGGVLIGSLALGIYRYTQRRKEA